MPRSRPASWVPRLATDQYEPPSPWVTTAIVIRGRPAAAPTTDVRPSGPNPTSATALTANATAAQAARPRLLTRDPPSRVAVIGPPAIVLTDDGGTTGERSPVARDSADERAGERRHLDRLLWIGRERQGAASADLELEGDELRVLLTPGPPAGEAERSRLGTEEDAAQRHAGAARHRALADVVARSRLVVPERELVERTLDRSEPRGRRR